MDVRNGNFQVDDLLNSDQFFNRVPKPLELAFVSACLGAPIQYKKEKLTGLDQMCMFVPNKKGFQPVMVTLGKEDSVGNGAYEAIYHQLGLDKIINLVKRNNQTEKLDSIDKECLSVISNKFYNNVGFTLGKGNGYEQTILIPRLDELESKIKDTYPEYYSNFAQMKTNYLNNFKAMYSEERKVGNNEEQNQLNA